MFQVILLDHITKSRSLYYQGVKVHKVSSWQPWQDRVIARKRFYSISILFHGRYVNYGSGAKRFPLQDVLQYTLEFANSRSPDSNGSPVSGNAVPSLFCNNNSNVQDVEMASPPRSLNNSPTPR